jgi:hypothetical protein
MIALSVRQPYAWMIVEGHKLEEYRSWQTRYRGPLAIHASKTIDRDAMQDLLDAFASDGEEPPADLLATGGIVGTVNLLDCQHDPDGYIWVVADPKPCELIPCKGKLNLFHVDMD